jgi:hypothetical protein
MLHILAIVASLMVIGPGALAPADPLVLETVEVRRVKYGFGLDEFAPVGVVRIAVDDCALLGFDGLAVVDGMGAYPVRVVDCCNSEHKSLASRGIVADVSAAGAGAELGHKEAILLLWDE